MSTCSICLGDVRQTRGTTPIRCGHIFHNHCLEEWKARGKNTCPVCRKIIDGKNFSITVQIQNNNTMTSNVVEIREESVLDVLDLFDFNFEVDDLPDVESILADLGMSLSDFDSTVFDTEG